jgi:hypothetical protein
MRDLVEKIQRAAIETAGLLKTKEAVNELKRVLDSGPEKNVRRAAVLALARIGDPATRDALSPLLQDKDEEVRAAAAEGLGRIGNPADAQILQSAFDNEKKTPARLGQCFALAILGNVDLGEMAPLRYLVNSLNSRSWKGVAQSYLNELVRVEPVRRALYPALGSGTVAERTGLLSAMAGSGAADAIQQIEPLARDVEVEVSAAATRALRILKASVR